MRGARRPAWRTATLLAVWVGLVCVDLQPVSLAAQEWNLARTVTVRRTDHGVPHILASTLEGAAFGLAYVEAEDHGQAVFDGFIRARGKLASVEGTRANIESDFTRAQTYEWARTTYPRLDSDAREFMEGFAKGINHYLTLHPDEVPPILAGGIDGIDVHATSIGWYDAGRARRFVRDLTAAVPEPSAPTADRSAPTADPFAATGNPSALSTDPSTDPTDPFAFAVHPDDGSNAWALAPTRTTSQRSILLRNPHLAWDAGYYEAHLRVPGVLDFYGDFRIGGVFGIIAGFNGRLGWATTNNAPDLSVVYQIARDPEIPGFYMLDGVAYPIRSQQLTVEIYDPERFPAGHGLETRTVQTTHVGPVIHEDDESIYIIRSADFQEFRRGEQFLGMMMAGSFEQWRASMRRLHISASNYTYADTDGNIFLVWNAKLPRLPHAYTPDAAVPVTGVRDMWSDFLPWDSLPQLLNPPGGYVRNENDPPYFTNLNAVLDRAAYPENMPDPRLRLRSQHSLNILHNDRRFSLEDVVEAKHSMGMLLADRVKDDLVTAVRIGDASPDARAGADLLDVWDDTAARDSRGSVLFALWWDEYVDAVDTSEVFAEPWDQARPTETPRGLGRPRVAAATFEAAVVKMRERFGVLDTPWGEAHRVRRGNVDTPVGGCGGELGCFRVLAFEDGEDGKWLANRGDGWVLAIEFDDVPRAYSVLAYGQSSREESPFFSDQAAMFADNRMKQVAFTEDDIRRRELRSYRPGEEIRPR